MLCRNCNNETLEGAAFCTQCGSPVLLDCQSCQAGNPRGSAYCYACGSGLLATAEQRAEPAARPPEAYWIEEAYRGEEPFQAEDPSRPGPAASSSATHVERSGFWNRFVGLLIDVGILIFPLMLVSMVLPDEGAFFLSPGLFRRVLGCMGSHARQAFAGNEHRAARRFAHWAGAGRCPVLRGDVVYAPFGRRLHNGWAARGQAGVA